MNMSASAPRWRRRRHTSGRSASAYLRRRGLVINATYVHISAVLDQQVGDRNRCRLVERLLPVASAGVYEVRIRDEQLSKLVDPTESGRHVRRKPHAAGQEQSRRFLGGVVQDGVRSILPLTHEVEVRTGGDQRLEHRRAFRSNVCGTLAEREHRCVDLFLDMR